MTSAEETQRKIQTCRDLQSVVKTMKALAAVSIRQYEKAVTSLQDYNLTVEKGLQILLRQNFRLKPTPIALTGTLGIVIFGSDQGMCGQFNEQVLRHFLDYVQPLQLPPERLKIIVVGDRLVGGLEREGFSPAIECRTPSSVKAITPLLQSMLVEIQGWQSKHNLQKLIFFYNNHDQKTGYQPHRRRVLPLDRKWLDRIQAKGWETNMVPQSNMASEALFSALIRQYFFVTLFQACAESLASENASRLASMQVAEKNISERLEALNLEYQNERQTGITNELLDIVSGFEALTN